MISPPVLKAMQPQQDETFKHIVCCVTGETNENIIMTDVGKSRLY